MVNSRPSTGINRLCHQLRIWYTSTLLQHPLRTFPDHMSGHECLDLSLCPVLAARLAAILASSLCCPGRVSWVVNPHHLNLLLQRTTDHPRPMPSITSLSNPWPQPEQRVSRFPAEIGFDSSSSYAVAPPSAQSEVFPRTSAPPST